MVTVKRPQRIFSFSDHSQRLPKEPPPGDRLDAQFHELSEAIRTTQEALAEIRRDDGQLKQQSNATELVKQATEKFMAGISPVVTVTDHNAMVARENMRSAAMYARDAEAAVSVARQLVSGLAAIRELIDSKAVSAKSSEDVVTMLSTEAENWANYSHAQADNAIAAKDEALQWAEYLAGPVVNSAEAPAYIAGSKFPNGLYYQPVQGGVAGLWSAKWWALQAFNLVGAASIFYLGPWDGPPLGGEQNPGTGQVVPNPITPGSIYYDTITHQLYVWNGTAWVASVSPTSAYQNRYVYIAAAGQQDFSGPDMNSQTPVVGSYPSDVHVNGVRLVPSLDYTITGNTLHIVGGLTVESIVQWDLLMQAVTAAGSITAWKINTMTPDGGTQNFTMQYFNGTSNVNTTVGSNAEMQVVLDGIPQEPGSDFTASGSTLHMAAAPPADGDFWAVWFKPG